MITPITLAKGEKISADGCYAISIDFYHSNCCCGPSISSSGLRTLDMKSPAHYWVSSYMNPDRIPDEPKEHFDFGHAAHVLLLGESGFREQFVVRPERWQDWRTKDARNWKIEQQLAGKTVLTPDQIPTVKGMADSLAAHPLAADLLQGHVETSLIFKDKLTGVFLKSRPDVLPVSDGMAVDYKTTTDASPDAVQRTISTYGYPLQGALIGKALKAVLDIDMTAFALVFQEKTPPFVVNVVEVDLDWIAYARRQLRRAIDTFARCYETGHFPGYEGESIVYMPDWLRKRYEYESDNGLLPQEDAA